MQKLRKCSFVTIIFFYLYVHPIKSVLMPAIQSVQTYLKNISDFRESSSLSNSSPSTWSWNKIHKTHKMQNNYLF